ncbi:unnamed protein product, partial [marine sediment metagenome]
SASGLFEEVNLSPQASKQDVDMLPDLSGVFEGSDEVDLEVPKVRSGELDVEF